MVSQARLGEWTGGVAYIGGEWNLGRTASTPHTLRQIRGFSSTSPHRSRMSSRHCLGVIRSFVILLPPLLVHLTHRLTLGNRVLPPLEVIHTSTRDGAEAGENKRSLRYQQVLAGFGNDPEHDIHSRTIRNRTVIGRASTAAAAILNKTRMKWR